MPSWFCCLSAETAAHTPLRDSGNPRGTSAWLAISRHVIVSHRLSVRGFVLFGGELLLRGIHAEFTPQMREPYRVHGASVTQQQPQLRDTNLGEERVKPTR